jgi:uncharacterized membrane protein YhiD involved in acid resistance
VSQWSERASAWLEERPFTLFVGLYAALSALALLVRRSVGGPLGEAIRGLTGGSGLGVLDPGALARGGAAEPPAAPLWAMTAVAMTAAGLLAVPVAWLYTITRQKRGYRQSVVHSLILLPVVVAGVVVLVKHSLALAFSLAGIVAAVRFRNTLEDSKDAVFIFVATGIGLAAGVELSAAAVLSVLFNFVTLLLFRSDFGRTPARLEGEMAEDRMRRALAMANRTSQFVARLDREILERMAPEQLDALAGRARQRRREVTGEPSGAMTGERPMSTVLVVRTDGSHIAREAVELQLSRLAKRWQFQRAATGDDGQAELQYALRLKKSCEPPWLLDAVRGERAKGVLDVRLQ